MIVKPNNVDQKSALLPYIPGPSTYSSETNFFQSAFPLQFTLLQGATAVTTNNQDPYVEFNTLGRNQHAIQVSSTNPYNATVLVEGTLDGVNWAPIETITQTGIVQFSGLYQSIRVSITSYTSGNITVTAITQRS